MGASIFDVLNLLSWFCLVASCVLISRPSCVLSVSSVFFPVFPSLLLRVCLPLSVCFVSPVFPPLCHPLVISPAVPPHLFLISSLVSVYVVSAFSLVFICLLLVCELCIPPPSPSSLCFQSPILLCFFFVCLFVFFMFDLNFAFLRLPFVLLF